MITLTKKTDYALVALATLAERFERDATPVSARKIADQYDLPLPLLMNILKTLAADGMVESTRGANGGYQLAVHPTEISLLKIITVLEGPINLAKCSAQDEHENQAGHADGTSSCHLAGDCPISTPMKRINQKLRTFLDDVTLAHLIDAGGPETGEAGGQSELELVMPGFVSPNVVNAKNMQFVPE